MIFHHKHIMKALHINQLAVLGSGSMGCGITLCLAQADLPVILWARGGENKAKQKIDLILQQEFQDLLFDKGEKNRILSNIFITSELNLVAESDFIIEAVVENLEVKKRLFTTLSNLCPPSTILASNTCTFSINEIALKVSYPERAIGMHFFYPAYRSPLIEVTCGRSTSEETFAVVRELAFLIKKEVIKVKDKPGFVVNRLLLGLVANAINLLDQESVTPEELDRAICLASQTLLGPLALADQIGLDTLLNGLKSLYVKLAEEQYKPPPLLEKMVREGRLGKKSGEGFYKY